MKDTERVLRAWRYWLVEPLTWLFYYFFQPNRFKREFEIKGFMKRFFSMLRLILPTFLSLYLFVVIVWFISRILFMELVKGPFSFNEFFTLDSNMVNLFLPIAYATLQSIVLGTLIGMTTNIRWGIISSIVLAITLGIAVGNLWGVSLDTAWSNALGITGNIITTIFGTGIVGGITGGFAGCIAGGFVANLTVIIIENTKKITTEDNSGNTVVSNSEDKLESMSEYRLANNLESNPVSITEDREVATEDDSRNISAIIEDNLEGKARHSVEDKSKSKTGDDSLDKARDSTVESAENIKKEMEAVTGIIAGIIIGIIVGGIVGLLIGGIAAFPGGSIPGVIAGGITGGILGGIASSIMVDDMDNIMGDILERTTRGKVGENLKDLRRVSLGVETSEEKTKRAMKIVWHIAKAITRDMQGVLWKKLTSGALNTILLGFWGGLIGGIAIGIIMGGIVLGCALGIALVITLPQVLNILGGVVLVMVFVIMLAFTRRHVMNKGLFSLLAIAMGAILAIMVPDTIANLLGHNIISLLPSSILNSTSKTIGVSIPSIVDIAGRIAFCIVVDISYIFIYILCLYRIPFYPISSLASLRSYLISLKNPSQVFKYLHRSSLFWDEYVFLPLPGLKRTLLIAAEQNTEQALKEITFIATERPQQMGVAQTTSLEIAIREMERRESLRDIAQAFQRLAEILPQESGLSKSEWVLPFARLNDASRDAARYSSPLSWQTRREALKDMVANLKKGYHSNAFKDAKLNERLVRVINNWLTIAQQEQEKLEIMLEKTGKIFNPYSPGQVLELQNTLFVGRRDLVQKLEEALSKGNRRPTFLLNGERRMGKSSTLKQLPYLLGARYLPIFYDLQSPKVLSSTVTLLSTISEEISKGLTYRGILARKLEYIQLKEASRENEAAVYRVFDEWLEGLERLLEQEDRMLLLIFDEFEKLEQAKHDGYLKLRLLLDWFRSVIQHRPRIALLFSGVQTLGEMGTEWASYFVNVQTLKVSFLQPAEAYTLITKPTPNFLTEEIFSEEVIEEIIRVTNRHPFLIQAVCSSLIDNLNAENRDRAEFQDVAKAVNQVLENWWDTFFRDLWERTDHEQRICLFMIRNLGRVDLQKIIDQSGMDRKNVYRTLETLQKRDLVLEENDSYSIAAPIFSEWLERNSYL